MNNEMAYLLGMITGNGKVQRGITSTTILIEIPHKKMMTEFQRDVSVYVKASITDIRQILEPLLGTALKFIQNPNISILSFTKQNEDYLMREIMRYIGNASSSDTIRISSEVFDFTTDERKQFVKGFADVTGYIRRSNYAFSEPNYRVYFEIPHNWELVADFCNLLKSIDIPVQNIDWGHPNMRDGNLKKYEQGKHDFWKKGAQNLHFFFPVKKRTGVPIPIRYRNARFFISGRFGAQAAFTLSGKIFLFTKKNTTIEMPPLSTVVPML